MTVEEFMSEDEIVDLVVRVAAGEASPDVAEETMRAVLEEILFREWLET